MTSTVLGLEQTIAWSSHFGAMDKIHCWLKKQSIVLSLSYRKMNRTLGCVFVFIQSASRCEMSLFMYVLDEQIRVYTIDSNDRNKNLTRIKMLWCQSEDSDGPFTKKRPSEWEELFKPLLYSERRVCTHSLQSCLPGWSKIIVYHIYPKKYCVETGSRSILQLIKKKMVRK